MTDNDRWPWFSHQHDIGIAAGGAGPFTVFDNGNTRIVGKPPLGLGRHCGPHDCFSRGMALTLDESTMSVTPVISTDLGVFSTVLGSAQLLSGGSYFFQPGQVHTKDGSAFHYPDLGPNLCNQPYFVVRAHG